MEKSMKTKRTGRVFTMAVLAIVLIAVFAACESVPASPGPDEPTAGTTPSAPSTPAQPPPTGNRPMVQVDAPIEDVTVIIAESFPPQYFLEVTSGLPNGCVRFGEHRVAREGKTVKVTVTNLEPGDLGLRACTMRYSFVETKIALGSDFEPGATYKVHVNDVTIDLVAQGGPPAMSTEEFEPVDSVEIVIGVDKAVLVVVSGLPDTCHELAGHVLRRNGDVITVEITNSVELGAACGEIYRTVETRIPIDGEVDPCKVYDVEINGDMRRVHPTVDCQTPNETPAPTPDADKVAVLAPIENIAIEVAESFPVQYFLVITSGLPNGCAEFDDYEMHREGASIFVKLTNLIPADKNITCTEQYRIVETRIALGTDLASGTVHTVDVNGKNETFTTQGVPGSTPPTGSFTPALLDKPFSINEDQKTWIEDADLDLAFVEVTEDSRCPRTVMCIWAGQAKILMGLVNAGTGEDLGRAELTIGAGAGTFGPFRIKALELDPYPEDPSASGQRPRYTATVIITKEQPRGEPVPLTPVGTDVTVKLRHEVDRSQPLTVTIIADVVGGPDNNKDLYCHGIEWQFGDGMGVGVMPGCIMWTSDSKIERHFEETYTYDSPGTYEITFTYGPLAPTSMQVQVH
jgi:hypothetical protein